MGWNVFRRSVSSIGSYNWSRNWRRVRVDVIRVGSSLTVYCWRDMSSMVRSRVQGFIGIEIGFDLYTGKREYRSYRVGTMECS